MDMFEYKENQILPVILLGEQGGDPANFIRFGLKRPVLRPFPWPITRDHQTVCKY